jgi:hypothetical protein
MRRMQCVLIVVTVSLLAACATALKSDPATAEKQVLQRVSLLLDRYVRNDQAGVAACLTRNAS